MRYIYIIRGNVKDARQFVGQRNRYKDAGLTLGKDVFAETQSPDVLRGVQADAVKVLVPQFHSGNVYSYIPSVIDHLSDYWQTMIGVVLHTKKGNNA